MIYYILTAITLISLISLIIIFRWQIMINRKKKLDYSEFNQFAVINVVIDYLAFKIVHFSQVILKKFYVFLLHFVKNSMATIRYLVVKIEKRFNRIIAATPEPDGVHKTDKVSSFLKEIKDHKEAAILEIKNVSDEESDDSSENK